MGLHPLGHGWVNLQPKRLCAAEKNTLGFQTPREVPYLNPQNLPKTPSFWCYFFGCDLGTLPKRNPQLPQGGVSKTQL